MLFGIKEGVVTILLQYRNTWFWLLLKEKSAGITIIQHLQSGLPAEVFSGKPQLL